MVIILLLILACIAALLAAAGVALGRINLLALAVLFYLLAVLVPVLAPDL